MNVNFIKSRKRVRFVAKLLPSFLSLFVKVVGPFGEASLALPGSPSLSLVSSYLRFEGDVRKGLTKTFVQQLNTVVAGVFAPYYKVLQLYGIGYRAYVPKFFSRSVCVLRAGFGAAELGVRLSPLVKLRSRKQRIVLVSPFKELMNAEAASIVALKGTNAYTGKGIRVPSFVHKPKQGKVRSR